MEDSAPPVYTHILDLPQLYTRPSAAELNSILELFAVAPPSWTTTTGKKSAATPTPTPPPGFSEYLTSIIASSLRWIHDEEEVERIKELAATRLAERCGRSALPCMVRTVSVPVYQPPVEAVVTSSPQPPAPATSLRDAVSRLKSSTSGTGSKIIHGLPTPPLSGTATPLPSSVATAIPPTPTATTDTDQADGGDEEITIHLNEPSLTADNLGLKTWCSSHLMSRLLPRLKAKVSSNLLPREICSGSVLELGAGTGLVGIAAAASGVVDPRGEMVVTDLPEIVENLRRNVELNREKGVLRDDNDDDGYEYGDNAGRTGKTADVVVRVLDWCDYSPSDSSSSPPPPPQSTHRLILAADPLYSPSHPRLLVNVVRNLLEKSPNARFIAQMPLRKGYEAEREDFRERMRSAGLVALGQGVDVGRDDWGGDSGRAEDDDESEGEGEDCGEGEEGDVRCWWSVWAWDDGAKAAREDGMEMSDTL